MTECLIENIAFGGEGIARLDQLVVFVPFTAPQDRIECEIIQKKKTFARARLVRLCEPNPIRVPPPCPYYQTCGGCQFQHISYPVQLDIKRRFIEDALNRIAKQPYVVPPILASSEPYGYRRHITLKLQSTFERWQAGFTSFSDHTLVPVNACLLFEQDMTGVLSILQQFIAKIPPVPQGSGYVRIFKKSNSAFLIVFHFDGPLPNQMQQISKALIEQFPLLSGMICRSWNETFALGHTDLSFSCLGADFIYSPFGFVQNHPEISEKIYHLVHESTQGTKRVLDLYCGIGVTSILSAQNAEKVIGIELNSDAIQMAERNAEYNHCKGIEFFCAQAETASSSILTDFRPDCVIVNPPRTGIAQRLLEDLTKAHCPKMIYISCNPATLARDIHYLADKNYTIASIQGFDMFPQTTHVETVAILQKT